MSLLYLAGPIADCEDDECVSWRKDILEVYPDSANPMIRDYRDNHHDNINEIVVLDKRDIDNSEIVLVRFTRISAGTMMEIIYAWSKGKPIIFWHDPDYPYEKLSPWIKYHCTTFVTSFDEACEKIDYYAGRD